MSELPRTFGKYTLLKLLAKGGMGEIFLARAGGISNFEKFYAIKKLLKKFARDPDVTGRFIDEAKLGARLQHPNIVQVHELGAVQEEMFMATEFVDGFDLRRVLRFCHEKKKRIPLDIALFIVREILAGLAYAHRQVDAEGKSINLIHRDISPQNVLVSFEGEVKIIDFGLAKSTQRSQETQANVLLGNFGYMSPEQARGHNLDVRTDIYSAGIVLFELVTGTKRFVDENPLRLLEMVARPTPILPSDRSPDVPTAVDRIYAEATKADKDSRFSNAEAFRDGITTALHQLNPRATREHLAQFLNHLFLGGQAPPAVDNDLLNKSIAMQLHDIVATTNAFQSTKKDDVRDRALTTGFEEDGPQTGSHEIMRSARVGDVLGHEELVGAARKLKAPVAPPSSGPVAAPPAQRAPVANPNELVPAPTLKKVASAPQRAPSGPQRQPAARVTAPAIERPPIQVPPNTLEVELEEDDNEATVVRGPGPVPAAELDLSIEAISEPDQEALQAAQSFGDPVAASSEPVLGDPLSADSPGVPTSVYEAPQWTGAPTPKAPTAEEKVKVTSRLEAVKPKAPPPSERAQAVVSTLGPTPEPESKPEPTMVVDFDSLPGAQMVDHVSGFGEGAGESLIIDFDASDDEDTLALPPAPPPPETLSDATPLAPEGPKIRPAAKPKGKTVATHVVGPKKS